MSFPNSFNIAHGYVKLYEGGYNRPYGKSGETYKGIDRRYKPNWKGWVIVDQLKRQYGTPKEEGSFNNPQLDYLVQDFIYTEYFLPSNSHKITNQKVLNLFFDFYFHKPVIAVATANYIATGKATGSAKLNDYAIGLINNNPKYFYEKFWALRLLHYNNNFLNKEYGINYVKAKQGVINRAKKFSSTY